MARTLLESSRAGDDIARFGGEEFALTITDVDGPGLRPIAERFRVLVRRSRVLVGQQDVPVTISVGGTIAEVGDTAEAILERADAALYQAKEAGRNRVVLLGDAGAAGLPPPDGRAPGAAAHGIGAARHADPWRPPSRPVLPRYAHGSYYGGS